MAHPVKRRRTDQSRILMGSFFTGLGGWECAAAAAVEKQFDGKAKLTVRFCVEKQPKLKQYLQKTYSAAAVHGKVEDVVLHDLPFVHLLCFSPSCRGYSIAGKMEGPEHGEGSIVLFVLDYIKLRQPIWICMEETILFRNYDIWEKVKKSLRYHYILQDADLGSQEFGIPQTRVRYYIIPYKTIQYYMILYNTI